MKYLVDKKKFAKLLRDRPALVRTIVNPTEDFAMSCFYLEKDERAWGAKFEEIYIELPNELKTLAVTRKFIKTSAGRLNILNIPQEILLQLSKKDRYLLLEQQNSSIINLPNPSYEEWLFVLSKNFRGYESVPDDIWTEETALAAAAQGSINYQGRFEFKFPDRLWNQDFAVKMVTVHTDTLDVVPSNLINNKVLRICLGRTLENIKIPEAAWDQATAESAVEALTHNIQYIPKQYITEKVNIIAAKNSVSYGLLTIKTYPVLVAYVANNSLIYSASKEAVSKIIHKMKDKETFIMDVLKVLNKNCNCLFDLGLEITEDLWLKIIKADPELIKSIKRCDQTPEMVDAFLGTASAEVIDRNAQNINLGKIKSHHAPFLIGCENTLIQEIRNKFLKAGEVHTETAETIEVDMAPSEYAKIKKIV